MTRSAGTSGLTFDGSPPSAAIASRIAARSTTAGTPVKSWRTTRLGMNGTSASPAPPGRQAASALTSSSRTMPAAGVAERVLEQDLEGDRRATEVGAERDGATGEGVEPVQVGEAGAEGCSGAEGIGRGHGLISIVEIGR